MLQKIKNRQKDQGFTIIETMIVLAIAGLIMLIVFLAVPALQRNARNTQRKNDAAQIAAAISNFISNNGGTLPSEVGAGQVAGGGAIESNVLVVGNTTTNNTETANLGYYRTSTTTAALGAQSNEVYINTVGGSTVTPNVVTTGSESSSSVSTSSVIIEVGESCNATNTAAGALSGRTAAIFYVLEGSSNNGYGSLQCTEQ